MNHLVNEDVIFELNKYLLEEKKLFSDEVEKG